MKVEPSKFDNLIKCFAHDVTATAAAKIVGVNRNTVNRYYNEFRKLIYDSQLSEGYHIKNVICEVDESYFGGKRIRGKSGRGASGKVIVFGIVERDGKAYTQIVENCKEATLIPIIESRIAKNCVVNSDMWKAYDKLRSKGYFHMRINHSGDSFASGIKHTNTIENFWGYCKMRLNKFHGICKLNFNQHIKECEYRYNHRSEDIYESIKMLVKKHLS